MARWRATVSDVSVHSCIMQGRTAAPPCTVCITAATGPTCSRPCTPVRQSKGMTKKLTPGMYPCFLNRCRNRNV